LGRSGGGEAGDGVPSTFSSKGTVCMGNGHVNTRDFIRTRLQNIFNNMIYVSVATIDSERHCVFLSSDRRFSKFVAIIGLMRAVYVHHRNNAAGALHTVTLFRYMNL